MPARTKTKPQLNHNVEKGVAHHFGAIVPVCKSDKDAQHRKNKRSANTRPRKGDQAVLTHQRWYCMELLEMRDSHPRHFRFKKPLGYSIVVDDTKCGLEHLMMVLFQNRASDYGDMTLREINRRRLAAGLPIVTPDTAAAAVARSLSSSGNITPCTTTAAIAIAPACCEAVADTKPVACKPAKSKSKKAVVKAEKAMTMKTKKGMLVKMEHSPRSKKTARCKRSRDDRDAAEEGADIKTEELYYAKLEQEEEEEMEQDYPVTERSYKRARSQSEIIMMEAFKECRRGASDDDTFLAASTAAAAAAADDDAGASHGQGEDKAWAFTSFDEHVPLNRLHACFVKELGDLDLSSATASDSDNDGAVPAVEDLWSGHHHHFDAWDPLATTQPSNGITPAAVLPTHISYNHATTTTPTVAAAAAAAAAATPTPTPTAQSGFATAAHHALSRDEAELTETSPRL